VKASLAPASPADPLTKPVSDEGATDHLPAIERWALIFAAALLFVALVVAMRNARAQLGVIAGATLAVVNTRTLRLLVGWLRPHRAAAALIVLFQLKLGLLALAVYLVLHYLPVSVLWFVLGLSVLPMSILARGIEFSLRPPTHAADPTSLLPKNTEGVLSRDG